MTKRESQIANLISTRIKKQDPRAEVILFGSHARGQSNEESDWDILILMDQPKANRSVEDRYRSEMFELELELGEAISTLVYSKSDWKTKFLYTPLYQNIKKEGIKI